MSLFFGLIVNIAAVAISAYLLSPYVILRDWYATIVTAVVLGLVNTFIKPVVSLFTLPFNLITLGLFSLIVNGIMILIVSRVVSGFEVVGLLWAIIFSLVLSFVSAVLNRITGS